ncbi:mucin-5AC-like isoform X4 [Iris pallida]|uniref:Mucin-5AC-like isoform X4 n=1 Tax=Iris pallida TaxID=29817 RepID=A0AAX6E1B3_IRIPA|nr:mucin-5AC-like isoform X4 [Iris pallida]
MAGCTLGKHRWLLRTWHDLYEGNYSMSSVVETLTERTLKATTEESSGWAVGQLWRRFAGVRKATRCDRSSGKCSGSAVTSSSAEEGVRTTPR